jgi:hypothetical protein
MNRDTNRYISLSNTSIQKFKKLYLSQHSKFIHSSWLLKEDLGRTVEMNEIEYTIAGLWDLVNARYIILLKPVNGGACYIADSKEVAHALGYSKMRNLVSGEEHKFSYVTKKNLTYIGESEPVSEREVDVDDDMAGDWEKYNEEDSEETEAEYIDPLVKALQDDITDDGDISANF